MMPASYMKRPQERGKSTDGLYQVRDPFYTRDAVPKLDIIVSFILICHFRGKRAPFTVLRLEQHEAVNVVIFREPISSPSIKHLGKRCSR